MAVTECRECKGRVSDTAERCPHCGAPVRGPKQKRPKKWHERTSVTLCVAAALAVIALGFIHIITGVRSPYALPFDIIRKDSFGYRETFVDAEAIESLPYTAAKLRHPLGVEALQRAGYLPDGVEFEATMMARQHESLELWQAQFEETLGRPQARWQDHLQAAGQLSQLDAEDARACNLRGMECARRGEYRAALAEFGRAIRKDPTLADAFHNRALVSIAIGNLGQGASDLGAILAIRPDFVEGYIRRGRLYVAMNEHDKAVSDFTKAVEIDSRCAEALFYRSLIHYTRGDREKAWEDVRKIQNLGLAVPAGFLQALRGRSGPVGST